MSSFKNVYIYAYIINKNLVLPNVQIYSSRLFIRYFLASSPDNIIMAQFSSYSFSFQYMVIAVKISAVAPQMDACFEVPQLSDKIQDIVTKISEQKLLKLSIRILLIIGLCSVYIIINKSREIAEEQNIIVKFIIKFLCLLLYINTSILAILTSIQAIFIYFNSDIDYKSVVMKYFDKPEKTRQTLKSMTMLFSNLNQNTFIEQKPAPQVQQPQGTAEANSTDMSGITDDGPVYRLYLNDNKLTEQELDDLNELYNSFKQ